MNMKNDSYKCIIQKSNYLEIRKWLVIYQNLYVK